MIALCAGQGLHCAPDRHASETALLVTDVSHSSVKRQSIGNCWLYAVASWTESLHKSYTGTEIDISESYWTWWHWYEQIIGSELQEVSTGGNFQTATSIIRRHGLVDEGVFITEEADSEMSSRQSEALTVVNQALAEGGSLHDRASRTPDAVRALLDQAFKTNMDTIIPIQPHELVVGRYQDGDNFTLMELLSRPALRWRILTFPQVHGAAAQPDLRIRNTRRKQWQRALRALNDRYPVIMSVMVDFNALDPSDGMFKLETLREAGEPGRQGGHLLPLQDYVVDDVPGFGTLGEGDLPSHMKTAALSGKLRYVKAKNSWGSGRPERGLSDGYTSFHAEYLSQQIEWTQEHGETSQWRAALTSFIIPPGY